MNTQTRTREAGFTLVELLIVMSVILILMTLAIPAMQSVIRRGNETSAIASLRDLNRDVEWPAPANIGRPRST